jgi:methylglutaconyl-CoA hydratase
MTEPAVLIESGGEGVALVTLNRPAKRNALNVALMEALSDAIATLNADGACRVVILRGAGPSFCAGLDLREAADQSSAERSGQALARMLQSVHESRLVFIAAVHGAAVGGGAGLLCACDLAVAAEDAHFAFPESRLGLVPGLVLPFLVRRVGERWVRELVLAGEAVDAQRAAQMGLVNLVVGREQLLVAATRMAHSVLRGAPEAVSAAKRLITAHAPRPVADELDVALAQHLAARRSHEAAEGLAAFRDKRPPSWARESSADPGRGENHG